MLKKSTLLSVSIFLVLFIGLSDYGYGCHGGKPPHGDYKGGDDGGTNKYSAMVTFADFDCGDVTNEDRDHFCSDGLGDYIDNVDNVKAGGDKFRFALGLTTGTFRRFFLDFSGNCVDSCGLVPVLDSVDEDTAKGLNSGSENGSVFSTADPGFSLLDMEVGEENSRARDVWIGFNDTVGDRWVLSFSPKGVKDLPWLK